MPRDMFRGGSPSQIWWAYCTAGKKERAAGIQIDHDGRPTQAASAITTGSGGASSNVGHVVSFDARVLVRECLKEVGRELGML